LQFDHQRRGDYEWPSDHDARPSDLIAVADPRADPGQRGDDATDAIT